MKQEDKELKQKVFALYLGTEIDISNTEYYQEQAKWGNPVTTCKIIGLQTDTSITFLQTNIINQNRGRLFFDVDVCTLILTPLSAISNEDAIEVAKHEFSFFGECEFEIKVVRERSKISIAAVSGENCLAKIEINNPYKLNIGGIDYLRSKGYALPAFGYTVEELINKGIIKVK